MTISRLDQDRYFMCRMDDFKTLADVIEQVPLDLSVRYVFCLAPISVQKPFVVAALLIVYINYIIIKLCHFIVFIDGSEV